MNKPKTNGEMTLDEFINTRVMTEVAKAAEKVLEDLPYSVEKQLSGKILGMIGFEKRFDETRLTNNSPLADYVSKYAVELAKNALGPVNVNIGKEQTDAIRAEYTRVFVSTIKDVIRDKAKKHAETFVEELMTAQLQTLTKDLTFDQIAQLEKKRLAIGDEKSVFADLAALIDFGSGPEIDPELED